MNSVDHSITTPEQDPAGERAEGVADAAEDDGGEDRQQELEAQLGLELGDRAGQDPGEAGEAGRRRPRSRGSPARC